MEPALIRDRLHLISTTGVLPATYHVSHAQWLQCRWHNWTCVKSDDAWLRQL